MWYLLLNYYTLTTYPYAYKQSSVEINEKQLILVGVHFSLQNNNIKYTLKWIQKENYHNTSLVNIKCFNYFVRFLATQVSYIKENLHCGHKIDPRPDSMRTQLSQICAHNGGMNALSVYKFEYCLKVISSWLNDIQE